jgi:hypothetical protein
MLSNKDFAHQRGRRVTRARCASGARRGWRWETYRILPGDGPGPRRDELPLDLSWKTERHHQPGRARLIEDPSDESLRAARIQETQPAVQKRDVA